MEEKNLNENKALEAKETDALQKNKSFSSAAVFVVGAIILIIVLAFVLLMLSKPRADFTTQLYFSQTADGEYWVSAGNAKGFKKIIIPEYYNDQKVVGISSSGFKGCKKLETIVIPDSIKYVGADAFDGCTSLSYNKYGNAIYIGTESNPYHILLEIEDKMLECDIHPNTKTLAGGAFAVSYITNIKIPEGVGYIGEKTFYDCKNLKSVEIPKSVTYIGEDAFMFCGRIVEVVNNSSFKITKESDDHGSVGLYALDIHSGKSKIVNRDGYLFYYYSGLTYLIGYTGEDTRLVLPESYNGRDYRIYKYCFYNNKSITSVVISDGVSSIEYAAFSGCSNLSSITISENVRSIGENAFSYCESLTSITIPESVTSIGDHAFCDCSSLTGITIPDSVTSIGEGAFQSCLDLKDVYFTGSEEEWNAISVSTDGNYNLTEATIHYNN